ncbi:hypothetical protein [Chryseobacterium binzhouense]|uniref:hypothetical protein n=1 Tax=Chryseobacterium binzhouense TaxID=2593646 RepID=UPI0028983FBA|nr:hypothetical protein [Chryseobacterium binzhouense]
MDRNINVLGNQISISKLLTSIILILVLSIYSFIEKPFVKDKYLDSDIKYFENNYFWKIYLAISIFILLFGFFKIEKSKEQMGMLILGWFLFVILFYTFFRGFITTNVMFLNQMKSLNKENVVYQLFNYDKIVSLHNTNSQEFIVQNNFIEKIDRKRKLNQQKILIQIKHGDTVNVLYDKGLFGFKYLN